MGNLNAEIIKTYYNNHKDGYNVEEVEINPNLSIVIKCVACKDEVFVADFYERILLVNFWRNGYTLIIEKNNIQHLEKEMNEKLLITKQ